MSHEPSFKLEEVFEELTGMTYEEGKDDEAGTYFSADHWVSGKAIAEALVELEEYWES